MFRRASDSANPMTWFEPALIALLLGTLAILAGARLRVPGTGTAAAKPVAPVPTLVANKHAPAFEFDRIVRYIERTGMRVLEVQTATRAAATHIDGAEMALNRLIAEVSAVLPEPWAPTVQPRRSLQPQAAE